MRFSWRLAAALLLAHLVGMLFPQGGLASPAGAGIEVATHEVAYLFGTQITFQVGIQSEQKISLVDLFFQSNNGVNTIVGRMQPDVTTGDFYYVHDVSQQFVKPFTTIDYWLRVSLADGSVITSDIYQFFYDDNRFTWQTLKRAPFTVHWYEGDAAFAQAVLDTAVLGMQQAQALVPAPPPGQVDIYAYGNTADYQFAQGALGPQWAGGHADPSAGLVLVSLRPGPEQRLQIERKIPHEIAHLMLYQATGAGFYNLPIWLNEGIASFLELYPNPDYRLLLENASQSGGLLGINDLCEAFPRDAAGALLSYAEATSFVRYLQQAYGNLGIQALVAAYSQGAACDLGAQVEPVGKTVTRLERDWRQAVFAENPWQPVLATVLPWVVVMGATMIGPLILLASQRAGKKEASLS